MLLLSLRIRLLSIDEQLHQRTTSLVITCKLRFEAGINNIFLHPMLQVLFSTTSCRRFVHSATEIDSPSAISMPLYTSITIADSSTTLIGSNASDQELLWRSLWRTSIRSIMKRTKRTSCRRKESLIKCVLDMCRHISHSRKVGSPGISLQRIILMILFCFVLD